MLGPVGLTVHRHFPRGRRELILVFGRSTNTQTLLLALTCRVDIPHFGGDPAPGNFKRRMSADDLGITMLRRRRDELPPPRRAQPPRRRAAPSSCVPRPRDAPPRGPPPSPPRAPRQTAGRAARGPAQRPARPASRPLLPGNCSVTA